MCVGKKEGKEGGNVCCRHVSVCVVCVGKKEGKEGGNVYCRHVSVCVVCVGKKEGKEGVNVCRRPGGVDSMDVARDLTDFPAGDSPPHGGGLSK